MAEKLTVRMYNVGFGDAFLITIPRESDSSPFRILVDCGSIKKSKLTMDKIVEQIVADVQDDDAKARIDVVVATHRHRDHVSGFANVAWADVAVKEVWMPWTENPSDPKAKRIREAQGALAAGLEPALAARASVSSAEEQVRLDGYREIALNALSNEKAMETLHHGFAGNPLRRFLPEEDRGQRPIVLDSALGLRAYILGPSRDEAVIKDMDPIEGESYLRLKSEMTTEFGAERPEPPEPFAQSWRDFESNDAVLSPDDEAAVERLGEGAEELLAATLDKAVNGTSLMIVLEVGSACLLLPGDAQWGTWNAALQVSLWRDLMKRIRLYKVGHHGSHNATPVSFLDDVGPRNFWAMTSTAKMAQWPGIPYAPLFTALERRTKRAASSLDEANVPAQYFSLKRSVYIEARVPF